MDDLPTTANELKPLMYGAIGYIVLAFGNWFAKNGIPWVKEALGMVSERDKQVAAAAKEGPIMVLEEVKRQLAETKEQRAADKKESDAKLSEMLTELKDLRKQHHDCETNQAAMKAELGYLRNELLELRSEGK